MGSEEPKKKKSFFSLFSKNKAAEPQADSGKETAAKESYPKGGYEYAKGEKILGRFIVEKAEKTDTTITYQALDKSQGISFYVKTFNDNILSTNNIAEEIINGARAWIKAGMHPNITYCYFTLQEKGLPLIFTEKTNGTSLKDKLKEGAFKDLRTGFNVCLEIAAGMEKAHKRSVVHGNLTPENISITQKNTPKSTISASSF